MIRFFSKNRTASLLVISAVSFALIGAFAPGFLSFATVRTILINGMIMMTVSLGVMGVLLTRNIDVSVGSTLGLSAAVLGLLLQAEVALPLAMAGALATGLLAGLLNGVLVAVIGVPAIIATLGTLGLYRGLLLILTGGVWIENLPQSLKALASPRFAGFPILIFVVAAIVLLAHLFLSHTRKGRFVYAVGDNRDAARHIGLPVRHIELSVFVFAGLMSAVGGIIFAAQIGFLPGQAGSGIELRVIAACVLGGISLLGGSGTVAGLVVAVFFLTSIDSALIYLRIPGYWNDLIAGAMLLLVLVVDGRLRLLIDKSVRAKRYANHASTDKGQSLIKATPGLTTSGGNQ
ncbi:ABC transporter permease [Devosia limi DSM 17137]|uniref:Autoinducer 2 import system permease protein LsrC n=1 Tax=Devosia limi DSM 17137 TaxID=1121477 RepID=A0A0F5L373_9HYPH|nr:ABC transporter permease [Devosia limi]KKB76818.1 ABC transporter permease [Devosia limi DSM 17137]SHF28574.1 AI-2 transport system permease protein [Devosia limi DSM 17137]